MDDAPQTYAVRLSVQARQDVFEAAERLAELSQDPPQARQWTNALYDTVSRLAANPHAYAVLSRETRLFGRETRQMLFRRTAKAAAYRVLFTVTEAGPDGPTVLVVHIRHSSRKPLGREEARRILGNQ